MRLLTHIVRLAQALDERCPALRRWIPIGLSGFNNLLQLLLSNDLCWCERSGRREGMRISLVKEVPISIIQCKIGRFLYDHH